MTKIEKLQNSLNENFRVLLAQQFEKHFMLEIKTEWDFINMHLVSKRSDGEDFTPAQFDFISAFSEGYEAAINQVRNWQ